jgi:DNA (cytosine-5)-methyltransferase 1
MDLLCGGFPCQDLSTSNTRGRPGLEGERSGLWREFARVVGILRPRFVIVENVAKPWREWVPVVRGDLGRLGYPSVPLHLSPADLGAPQHRERVFVVADADPEGQPLRALDAEVARLCADAGRSRSPWGHPFAGPVRVDDGVPGGMDAVHALGNAVVPAVAEVIGRAIVAVRLPFPMFVAVEG